MKHQYTYAQILAIEKDMQSIMKNNPGIYMLMYTKIQMFYQQATPVLQRITKAIDDIKEKYVEKTPEGKFMVIKTPEGNRIWQFKSAVSDLASATILTGKALELKFNQAIDDYLNSNSVTIALS